MPVAEELDQLLSVNEVAGHDLVYGELLAGDRGGRPELLGAYARMHQTRTVPHAEVVDFVRVRKLQGRGAGWVDIHLLASALVSRSQLWTADERLAALAAELGIAYRPLIPA